jgi:hypothetical protein
MVSLVDLGPAVGSVTLRDKPVELIGITAEHIVGIMISFPEVRKILAEKEVDLTMLVTQFPLAAAMLMAAGTGHADESKEIEAASKLPIGEQYEILAKLIEISFPKGVQSLLDGVHGALASAAARGWVQATKSPAQSSHASVQDATNEIAGTQRPDSSAPGSSLSAETSSQETTSNSA